ncbi:hypothetical protein GIY62_23005 [Burkholderia plantarii]|uniref:hypothetical protein n=1 Tax=Burkholderia plantarii TaxID=41899 RepID=UPI00272C62F2|nr:hypothetical protein [Burkholderia plantarii]WLE63200.1 hypothetical protein GIY62_23005 [Burkholderia plantarii]
MANEMLRDAAECGRDKNSDGALAMVADARPAKPRREVPGRSRPDASRPGRRRCTPGALAA